MFVCQNEISTAYKVFHKTHCSPHEKYIPNQTENDNKQV